MIKFYKAANILPANQRVITDGIIQIDNGKIVNLLTKEQFEQLNITDNIIDFGKAVITPGFINLHTHLQFTNLQKTTSNQGFASWVIDLMQQYSRLDIEQKIISLRAGLKETVLSGVTCLAQISKEEEFLETFNEVDVKSYVFLETFSNTADTSINEFQNLKEKIKRMEQNKNNNVYFGISPHSIYNVHPILWKKISQFSNENDYLVHTHLAESEDEINWLKYGESKIDLIHKFVGWDKVYPEITGLDPLQYLEYLGIAKNIGKNLILTHLNQLCDDSFGILDKYGNKVACCPRSNMMLHGKTLTLTKTGYNLSDKIGIGTDSKFSNYDLNILNEAKFIKNNTNPDLLKILDMLTINAAKILKLDDKIGSLEKNKDADFLVFRLDDNETYLDIISKEGPDEAYIKGKPIILNKLLVNFVE